MATPQFSSKPRISPTVVSVIGGAIGVLLLVIGLVTLARTGVPTDSFSEPVTTVGPFERTPLMGIIEIIIGVLTVSAAASADRSSLTGLGLVSLVFGLVWMIEPGAFSGLLGVGRETAVLYLVIAVVCLVAGLLGGVWRRERIVEY